jgi:putative ABC transport system permease protein
MIGMLSSVFGGQVDTVAREESGPFDILATARGSDPPEASDIASIDGVDRVVAANYGIPLFRPDGVADARRWPAVGITDEFTEVGPPELGSWAARFHSDQEAWEEVASDYSVVIVSEEFLKQGGPPQGLVEIGEELSVIDPVTGTTTTREVVGLLASDEARAGAYMSFDSLDDALGGRATESRFYVVASGSIDDAATRLQGSFVANGLEAESFHGIVDEGLDGTVQFMRLMQGYLALGLIIGIAGLGVVMVRAVRDRRHEIGVLRALGFIPGEVRRAFLLESGFVALEAIVIGLTLGLVMAAQLIEAGNFGDSGTFSVPWLQVVLVCGVAFVAALLATAWPAQAASRIPPAVALRVSE